MKISLINYTQNAEEILIFSKHTRHLSEAKNFQTILDMDKKDKEEELKYVFGTIGSALEFVDYVFLIERVTRAFTHQLVRHRIGTSFAQQSLRFADASGFDYYLEDSEEYHSAMAVIKEKYSEMIEKGVNIQEARGILPTNILTNILFKANLRTLSEMIPMRLCVRTQKEFRVMAEKTKNLITEVHNWPEEIFDVYCIKHDRCPWENYDKCPMKNKWTILEKSNEQAENMRSYFRKLNNFNPQPK